MPDIPNHLRVVQTLTAAQRADLTARSNRRGIQAIGVHLGLIGCVGYAIATGIHTAWLMLPQGILLVFLFCPMHESVHRTSFRSDWISDRVARLCGLVLLLPTDWFRYFHFAHHRHTHDPQRDPELADAPADTLAAHLKTISGLPVWWLHVKTLLLNAFGAVRYAYVPAAGRAKIRREARLMLGFYLSLVGISIAASSTLLLMVWIIPMLLGQPFLRLYLMAEHGGCPQVANMLENSRTTYTTRIIRKLAWNMPYHAEHHTLPAVPFHKLPQFHQLTRAHAGTIEHGYTAYHRRRLAELWAG